MTPDNSVGTDCGRGIGMGGGGQRGKIDATAIEYQSKSLKYIVKDNINIK